MRSLAILSHVAVAGERPDRMGAVLASRWGIAVATMAAGATVGAIEYLAHSAAIDAELSPIDAAGIDAALVAVVAAGLVFIILKSWRVRRLEVIRQLRVVAELNHNVRNALQAILYCHCLPPEQQTQVILDNVNRIATTLTHLFPVIDDRR